MHVLPYEVAASFAVWRQEVEIDGPCVRVLCRLARRLVVIDCEMRRILLAGDCLDDQVLELGPRWYEQADAFLAAGGPFAEYDWHSTPG